MPPRCCRGVAEGWSLLERRLQKRPLSPLTSLTRLAPATFLPPHSSPFQHPTPPHSSLAPPPPAPPLSRSSPEGDPDRAERRKAAGRGRRRHTGRTRHPHRRPPPAQPVHHGGARAVSSLSLAAARRGHCGGERSRIVTKRGSSYLGLKHTLIHTAGFALFVCISQGTVKRNWLYLRLIARYIVR